VKPGAHYGVGKVCWGGGGGVFLQLEDSVRGSLGPVGGLL